MSATNTATKLAPEEVMDLRALAEEIVASYEARVEAVGNIIDATHEMLEGYRNERQKVGIELKEILANGASLRRKDFDKMMSEIFAKQDEAEKEIRKVLKVFLREQKEIASQLKAALAGGDFEMLRKMQLEVIDMVEKMKKILLLFHNEQQKFTKILKDLRNKGSSLTIREFKEVISQMREREKRTSPVQEMTVPDMAEMSRVASAVT